MEESTIEPIISHEEISDTFVKSEEEKNLGNEAFKTKNFDEAIKHYSEAIRLNPSNAVYYSNRSACYASKSNWKASLEDALLCVSKDPKFIKGYYRLATAQMELQMFDDADATIKLGEAFESEKELMSKLRKTLQTKKAVFTSKIAKKSPKQLDESQRKEFLELQEQYNTYSKDMRSVSLRLANAQREDRSNQVTMNHVFSLPPEVNTYRSVGRAFLYTPREDMVQILESEQSALIKMQRDLVDRKEFLERRISSLTTNLKEMTSNV